MQRKYLQRAAQGENIGSWQSMMKMLAQHMIKTNNEDFSWKFRFLRPANNYMRVGYGQANNLEGVLVLCLGSKL